MINAEKAEVGLRNFIMEKVSILVLGIDPEL